MGEHMINNGEILDRYLGPVYNLGDLDKKLEGCFSTLNDQSEVNKFIHEQFTKNSDFYVKMYTNYDFFEGLIKNSLTKIKINKESPINILDLGSGSGNTIIPLLKLFPNSPIIASDLSLDLLYKLKQNIDNLYQESNSILLQLNAEKLNFLDNSFDLITGGAILHHLFHPEKTIEGCSNILKNNGSALFYEPFQEGNMILCYIYETIINDDACKINEHTKNFLKNMVWDFKTRSGSNKEEDIFSKIDDKWLFTKSYFYDLCDRFEFTKCILYPLYDTAHLFERQTLINLTFVDRNNTKDLLPAFVWNKIKSFDEYFSEEFKKELFIEGCIILNK